MQNSQIKSHSILTFLLFSVILIFIGCQIEEIDSPPTGSISVSAYNLEGDEIIGGEIFLDGSTSNQFTPDTLENVAVGSHTIRVKARGFVENESSIQVFENELALLQFELELAEPGGLEVLSAPAGASIIIDQVMVSEVTPFIFADAESGLRKVSVFLDGYMTQTPALISIVVDPSDTASVSFNLQPGTIGNNEGEIAIDFTLEDDFGNMVSLHQYRGHVILLTFFFEDCVGCNLEFPYIQDIYEDYSPYGAQIIGIDPMFFDDLQSVQNVRNAHGLTFKLLLDWGNIFCGPDNYGVQAYPTNIIIDQGGEIHTRMLNTTYGQLAEIFDTLLGL